MLTVNHFNWAVC